MKTCPNCHGQITDEASFCPICGTAVETIPQLASQPEPAYTQPPEYFPPVPEFDPYDHTKEFEAADIAGNKLVCMLAYLLDAVGIIIALLAAKESEYTAFHVKQSMKFTIVEVLLCLVMAVLCWTFIVPIVGAAALLVLLIIKFISFVQVCGGQAKEPALIRSLKFLS